jgi:hypothetical protein
MGANATTFVPAYVAGEVLTAADLSVTNSGIPVFATTVTRDAAFDGTGEKVLAEGQFAYIEATNTTQYYDGAAWQSVGVTPGLVLISSTTISAAGTTNVNDVFSATYDNYKIILVGTASTGGAVALTMRLRVAGADATTNYSLQRQYNFGTSVAADRDTTGTDDWFFNDTVNSSRFANDITLMSPFLAASTKMLTLFTGDSTSTGLINGTTSGVNTNATSYTGFSILTGGTISGVLKVYGMAN